MKNKKTATACKNDLIENEEKESSSEDFFERLQEIYPTMTLDEIGDFLLNTYLYQRKFKMPK